MYKKVYRYVMDNEMFAPGDNVVIGLSGGADSVCLFFIMSRLAKEMSLKLHCVHVNHGIRGEEALRDQKFCEKLCRENGISIDVVSVDVKGVADREGMTVEEAGRLVRYNAFNDKVNAVGGGKIAVAHHMNDQAETVLFNMVRGGGLRGLSGIKAVNDNIVRPLLVVGRGEIEEYLNKNRVDYVTDSTNLSNDYMRNKLRNQIIPFIEKEINSEAVSNINRAASICEKAQRYITKQAKLAYDICVTEINGQYKIAIEAFEKLDEIIQSYVVWEIFSRLYNGVKDITEKHILSVITLSEGPTGKSVNLPEGIIASRVYDDITLGIPKGGPQFLIPNYNMEVVSWDKERVIEKKDYTKYFDYDKIKGNVEFRTRQTGDYLVVDSKGSKKKLKDYFIDEKIPKNMRDCIPLLADGNHIMWVVGSRISEAYKVDENTTHVLIVTIEGNKNYEET